METTAPRFKSIFSEPRPSCDELPLYAVRGNMSAREQYEAAYRAERVYAKSIRNNVSGMTAEINHLFAAVHGYNTFYVNAASVSKKALEVEEFYQRHNHRRLLMMHYNNAARQRITFSFFGYKAPTCNSSEIDNSELVF